MRTTPYFDFTNTGTANQVSSLYWQVRELLEEVVASKSIVFPSDQRLCRWSTLNAFRSSRTVPQKTRFADLELSLDLAKQALADRSA